MDFNLNSEQRLLEDSVQRFVHNEYGFDKRAVLLRDGLASAGHWQTFADHGWLAAAVPEHDGGFGGSAIETALIMGQLGRALVLEPYLGCAVFAAQTLLATGAHAHKQALLPGLMDGSFCLAVAYSEASAQGDPALVETTATPCPEGYVLDGHKTLVLGAVGASAFIVSARMASSAEATDGGISLFLVQASTPGLSVRPWRLHDGTSAAELVLEQVRVDALALLGPPGSGLAALQIGLAHAVAGLCADLVGGMDKVIEITSDYLRLRRQFGVPIASFQVLQHRMADMAAETELARSMLYALLTAMVDERPPALAHAVSQAKALVCRASRYVCGQAIQLHGGIGMTEECAVGHYFKRAVVADLLFGSADLHEELCADRLQDA